MGANPAAIFGLVLSTACLCLLVIQMTVLSGRRWTANKYKITGAKVMKALKTGSTVTLATCFVLCNVVLAAVWLHNESHTRFLSIFRHAFFLLWVCSVMRHWLFLFDPLGRLVNQLAVQIAWVIVRITTVFACIFILLVMKLHYHFGLDTDSSGLDFAIYSATSALTFAVALRFYFMLRKFFFSCRRALLHSSK